MAKLLFRGRSDGMYEDVTWVETRRQPAYCSALTRCIESFKEHHESRSHDVGLKKAGAKTAAHKR